MTEGELLAEFKAVNETLEIAREHGLEAEVMWMALQHQTILCREGKPNITESCYVGLANWDI